ncbi:eukaryotic mitochondrial regulator protein-domain-containing protein [Zopfochytrium polystomum]|nr:eukaryotic mitochondrial regulator protein-domain-containing protein [Zopfochytrium polystomum]
MEKRAAHARAKMWLEGEGSKFENPSGSRDSNFVGGPRRPFPMNRFYVPIAPVRDETRTTIYERYMSDPKTQTPLKLAKEHKLSIARVQAILRLKALEASMRDAGKEVQEQLNEGMERMLITSSVQRMNEPLHVTPAERMKPLFQLLDEDQGVTPEDAAKLLKLEPFHAVQARLDVDAQRMFTIDPAAESRAKDVQTPPIAKDPVNASKFTFAFVDTSKPLDRPLYMRDRNGVFRKGSRYEKYRKEHPAPRFFL